MNKPSTEIEAKFEVKSFKEIKQKLRKLGAKNLGRHLEHNEFFDFPDKKLGKKRNGLRLRKTNKTILTFKGRAFLQKNIMKREELELQVENFDTMKKIFERLGLKSWLAYKKYRTTYKISGAEIVLDELPFGKFLEIEGSKKKIVQIAKKLGLDLTN
ncbi:MAG: class IV adenylate cyclase, partial [Candidatus Diapherotrites archaeon]|nr:class IV adenylate cyclase [Candidatus Diapherotrites archaeon]